MNNKSKETNTVSAFTIMSKTLSATFSRMKPFFFLLLLTAVGGMLLELVPPLLLKKIVDTYLKPNSSGNLWIPAAWYLLASLGTSAVSFAQVFVTTYIGQNILLELRLLMAEHLTRLPMAYFTRTPAGETMSRITSDVDAVNSLFSQGIISAVTDFVKVFGIIAAMYLISPALCLIALAAIPVVYLTSNFFRKNIYKTQLQIRKAVGAINVFLQEIFNGMKIIKTYGKEELYDEQFEKPLTTHLAAINHAAVYDSYFPCVMQTIRAAVIAAVVWTGARTGAVDNIAISIGGLAAMADLVSRLFGPVESLSQQFQTIQQAFAGLKRIVEFLAEPPEERTRIIGGNNGDAPQVKDQTALGSSGSIYAVEISNVSFGYQAGKPILKKITMRVPGGKRVAIVGRTGAGKTSLMNLAAGLYKPWDGTISVMGQDPFLADASDRRKLIGVVPQNVHMFEGTILENITLRDDGITRKQAEKAAALVGLHEFIISLDKGYDTPLGTEGARLSYGQSQLLSLARAVVSDPAVLLLDEPTSGMDAVTEARVFEAFRSASKNRTIITISHRLSGIIEADEIFIMSSGRIVQSGTPSELAAEKGWYSVFKQLEDIGWRVD